ncbi:phytanoyl-CoA dioxygenase family protein [Chloroflexi bacterium TSY]|nr:phytanoyl-CoA dioxygenase family protein [Chloroflexi bacterium TSY]
MAVLDAIPDMTRDLQFFAAETTNPKMLSPDQIARFNEKRYIFPVDLFTPEEIVANRLYFEKLLKMAYDAGLDRYSINGWQKDCEGIYDLVTDDRILDYVEDILGPNIVCTMTHYFAKMPGDATAVYWHQDASFWPLTPSKVLTVWIAIDDVDVENGAMKVFPGTHKLGRIPFEWVTDEEDGVLNQHVHNPEQYADPVSIELKAGQISLHTDMLLHGSQPNPSNRRRCGLTIRYFPADVRTRELDSAPGIIARGYDPDGYWQHIPRPQGDRIPPHLLEAIE